MLGPADRHRGYRRRQDAREAASSTLNYFGVSGNFRSLQKFANEAQHYWLKWLRRRSNRTRLYGERVDAFFERFPLPRPRITIRIWAA